MFCGIGNMGYQMVYLLNNWGENIDYGFQYMTKMFKLLAKLYNNY